MSRFAPSWLSVAALAASFTAGCVDSAPLECEGPSCNPAGSGGADGSGGASGGEGERRVVGYQPLWYQELDPSRTDWSKLTHLCLAFANPGPVGGDDEVQFYKFGTTVQDDATIEAYVSAAHAAGVKVLASIAGAGESSQRVAARIVPEKVDAFIESLERLIDRFDLDGIDVDIEGTDNVVGNHYEPFVLKLGEVLHERGLIMTAAVARWYADGISVAALQAFDFINVMSYDHCGSWSEACEHSSMAGAREDMSYWINRRNFPFDRTVLGVPFYGYCWGDGCPNGSLSYRAILQHWPDAADKDWIEGDDFVVSYNGADTIRKKVALGHQNGGVMIWELSQDATGDESLLKVIGEEME